ncbi:MAG: hypothetical protein JNM93_09320 [Bacteriovoracaceae bacterium]|nr:hypothetical protein [Bacteriovoracaceae bacterium]
MVNLKQLFLSKWQSKKFAPCYHLTQIESTSEENLKIWIKDLLTTYIQQTNPKLSLENCFDISFLSTQNKNYQMEELTELFYFQESKPMQLPHKFIVIEDAHKLTELGQNKLLKLLEEPQAFLSLIVLNPYGKKLLPTVESRMLKFRFKFTQQVTNEHNLSQLKELFQKPISLSEFIEKFQDDDEEEKLYSSLMSFDLADYKYYLELTKLLQWQAESMTFHNSSTERLAQTYEFLHTHLAPTKTATTSL